MARLLLIDDDELLREMLAKSLEAAGHAVTQAANGRHALADPAIELVITDLIMPGQEGIETIATLHRARPGLPVIAISGVPANSRIYLKLAARLGAHRVRPKPFPRPRSCTLVDELLPPPRNIPVKPR